MKTYLTLLFYLESSIVINRDNGFTLTEVIVGTALAGLVMLGLAVVYMLGVDAWTKTASRIELQRTASSTLYEISRDIQRADSLEILEGGNTLYCRVPDFDGDSLSTAIYYIMKEQVLIKKIDEVEKKLIPNDEHDSLTLELIESVPLFNYSRTVPTASYERVVDINFKIVHTKNKVKELMPFSTTVGARNL